MRSKVLNSVKGFRWQQWLILVVFLLIASFTVFKAVHTVQRVNYWKAHRDEPLRGWMTIGYVAHSYGVPPHVLYQALGLPHKPPDKRPLRVIAKAQHRSIGEIEAILHEAIIHARPPYPPPPPPDQSPNQGRLP